MAPQTTGSRTHKGPGCGSSTGTMERPSEGGQVVERDQYSRLSTEEDEDDGRVLGDEGREEAEGDEDHPGGANTQQVGQVQVGVQVGGGGIGLRRSSSADSIVDLHHHRHHHHQALEESQQPLPLLVKDPPLRHHLHHPSSSSSSHHNQLRLHHHQHHHNRHKHHHKHHQRHPHFLLQQQQRPPKGSSHLMESRATLCSTLEQEQCLLEEGNSDSRISHQGASAVAGILTGNTAATGSRTGSGSFASSSIASGSGAYGGGAAGTSRLTFGEVSVPESMLRTPLHKTDHKAYYSFVNPALVPSLTDFQMQTKGRDEWYLDSDGLAHLYEVPAANCIKAEMVPPARRAIKNLVVLSLAFMFVLTAFVSLQTLQSTMNHADGLGVVSLSCVYASTVFSCLLAPAVIKRLTTKWTLVLAFSLFLIYIGCNFYPIAPVVIPASVLLGLLTGPLWSAQSTYLTTLAIQYASANKQLQDTTINKFNGIFMSIVQTSQVWGNLVSTLVLSHDNVTASVNKALSQANLLQLQVVPSSLTPGVNGSGGTIGAIVSCSFRCGALDCGVHEYPDIEAMPGLPAIQHTVAHVPTNVRMLLLGVQLACAITGVVLVTSLLDRNSLNTTDGKYPGSLSSQQLFSATFKMFQDPRLQLLLPLVVFTGLEQGFVFGEFTKSYVNCALGIHKIGSVMMCFGAMTALTALFIGAISRHIKRFAIMTSGTLFNTGLLIVLLWWKPRHDDLPMFYVIASCLGLCDAIWQTQTNTLFGVLFAEKQEAGFASYRMFQAIGFAISFGYSYYLCVSTKVYIMTGVLLVSLLLYSIIEFRLYQQARTREGVVVL